MRLFIDFIPVLIWALLAAALVIVMLFASWVLRPHVLQNSEKTSSYECGEVPIGPARIAFPYSYLTYTILFLVVDVMGAFLWLFASASIELRTDIAVVWQVVLFVLLILVGIGFALKMVPETFLSGQETLELYRSAKAACEEQQTKEDGR